MSKKDKVNIIIFYTLWRSISPILKIFEHGLPLPKKIKNKKNKKSRKSLWKIGKMLVELAKGHSRKNGATLWSDTIFHTGVVIKRSPPTRKNDTTL